MRTVNVHDGADSLRWDRRGRRLPALHEGLRPTRGVASLTSEPPDLCPEADMSRAYLVVLRVVGMVLCSWLCFSAASGATVGSRHHQRRRDRPQGPGARGHRDRPQRGRALTRFA